MRSDPLAYLSTELDALKQQGLYRHLRILDEQQKAKTTFDHREVVNLSSNNYLGLATHPRLVEAALETTRRLGVGSGSVRTIAGTMLRMLVGDEAFFTGVRSFYRTMRFKKAGTEDFRAAMEAATGQSLQRFFDRWIYGATLPRLKFSYSVDGGAVALRVEQLGDEVFDLPLVVSLQYSDRKPVEIVIPVNDRTVEKRVPLTGTLRGVDISKDGATLAEIAKS